MDVWGKIYRDHYEGIGKPHHIERDDGLDTEFASAANYFAEPRRPAVCNRLDLIDGPVLDVGAEDRRGSRASGCATRAWWMSGSTFICRPTRNSKPRSWRPAGFWRSAL